MERRTTEQRGMICRGVVMQMNPQTYWGKLVYAPTDAGHAVVDALSAALIIKASKTVRQLREDAVEATRVALEMSFHSTSWHMQPGRRDWLPQPGEIVEVHLNSDYKLVAVWYAEP
jgi:hypothetical protein